MNAFGRFNFSSLRLRLIAAFAAVALIASVLASGIAYVLFRRGVLERAQDTVLTDVRGTIARIVPRELPQGVSATVSTEILGALRAAGYQAAVLPAPPGDGSAPPRPALGVPVSTTFATQAQHRMVFRRVVSHGVPYVLVGTPVAGYTPGRAKPEGTTLPLFFVAASLRKEAADLDTFARAIAIADALALAAALLFATVAARGVLLPVRRLGTAARALGAGRLDARVPVRGRDELAGLARTFNETAAALEDTVTELRAMEARSRRFVADVSHELRTPLTSMIALTDGVMGGGNGSNREAAMLAAETRRLAELVEDLIEISRFDAGVAALVPDDVVVAEAVAATLSARGWADQVAVEGPEDLVARLDPRRLDVILANLIGNAFTHGRPPVRVAFAPAARDGRPGFELAVADGGPGIPSELHTVVFDRFVKAGAARPRGTGSGLGLSIARENALLHGGSLDAGDGPYGGAVLRLWLPAGEAG